MKLIPMHDNIFVQKDKAEERRTPGGVVLPMDAQQAPDTATVIAVGPGRVLPDGTMVVPSVQAGDTILIGRFSGIEVNWGLEKRLVVPWSDVLGVVKDAGVVNVDDNS